MRVLLLLLFSFGIQASQTIIVSVEQKITSSDEEVRESAVLKAKLFGANSLPSIVGGTQRLVDGNLKEEIVAYSVGQLNLVMISELWDRSNDKYYMTAEVSIDESETSKLIERVKDNLDAQAKLASLYGVIDDLIERETLSRMDAAKLDYEINKVLLSPVIRGNYQDSKNATDNYLASLLEYFSLSIEEQVLNKSKLKLIRVDELHLYLRLKFDKLAVDEAIKSMLEDDIVYSVLEHNSVRDRSVFGSLKVCVNGNKPNTGLGIWSDDGYSTNYRIFHNNQTNYLNPESYEFRVHLCH